MDKVVGFNRCFREFNRSRARYRIAMGSAGSGKSVNIAQDYILKLSDPQNKRANLLVVRGTEASHKDSTFAELCKAVQVMGLERYWTIRQNPSLELYCGLTGCGIIFRGFNDERSRERVKSITFRSGDLTWIWVEEATDLREADVDILDDRLRGALPPGLYYQMTFSFNPVSAQHWIKRKYWDYDSPDIFRSHSTYLDNRFLDEGYHRRMLMRKEQDPDGYRIYGLGEWGEQGGLILTNYQIEDLSGKGDFDIRLYAQDFGFNHANCILDIGFRDGELFVLRELYVYEMDTEEIIQLAGRMGLDKRLLMYCDSAEPDRIKMWRKAGYRAYPVKKEPGSVKAQIDYLKQRKIHLDGSCVNTIREIQQWKWLKDNRTGLWLDEPTPIQDDAMACLRYAVEPLRRNKRLRSLPAGTL